VPLNGIDTEVAVVAPLTLTDALAEPLTRGLNETFIAQLAPAARERPTGQLLDWMNSHEYEPPKEIDRIASGPVPVLVKVTVCAALVVLTVWFPNARFAGVTATVEVPVPFSATVSVGLTGSELRIASDADLAPAAAGLNVTLTEQLAPAARLIPHVLVWVKSPGLVPVRLMLLIVSAALPVLDNVIAWAALLVFTAWLPKGRLPGFTDATGAVRVAPVPLSATVCGLAGSESEMDIAAAFAPAVLGLNATIIVQLEFAGTITHPLVKRKSAAFVPVSVTLLILIVVAPLLERETILYALDVLSDWLPNASDAGVRLTAVPTPLRDTVNVGFAGSELLTDKDADRAPAAVGLKVTLTVQFAPAARLAPHVLFCAKSEALAPVRPMLLIVNGAVPVLDSVTVWAALVVLTN